MSDPPAAELALLDVLIWATRGRTWGFRFLHHQGPGDPLVEYDKAFSGIEEGAKVYRRLGGWVVLRFPDPEGRQDSAGRVIPQEFVVQGRLASKIESVDDGPREIWKPPISKHFSRHWDSPEPPPTLSE